MDKKIRMDRENRIHNKKEQKEKSKTSLEYLFEEGNKEWIRLQEERKNELKRRYRITSSAPPPRPNKINSFKDFPDGMFSMIEVHGNCKFLCPYENCNDVYPSLSRVKRHYMSHTNIKPFKCMNEQCNKRFSRKDNMESHYKRHCKYTDPEEKQMYREHGT